MASYFDAGNVLLTGYPEHWVAGAGGADPPGAFQGFPPQRGHGRRILRPALGRRRLACRRCGRCARSGFDGWVAAEMIPPVPFYKHCPEALIHNTARAMDAILALGA